MITKEKIINFNDKTQQLNELQNSNKNLEKEKTDLLEKTEQQTKEINQLESIINVLNEKIKLLGKNENNFVNDNNEINKKRLSTPSFKSPVEDIERINSNFRKKKFRNIWISKTNSHNGSRKKRKQ